MGNPVTNHDYFADLAGEARDTPLTNNQLIAIMASNGSTAGLTNEERERLNSIANKADLVGGKVPEAQLPSYIDSVQEFETLAEFPATGESNVIYLATSTNAPYRWGGSSYVQLSSGLVLGDTSSSAMRGDQGKIAYEHTMLVNNPHQVTKGQIGLGNVSNTSDSEKPVSTAVQSALDNKVSTDDARLSNTRTPTDASVTNAKLSTELQASISKANTALQSAPVTSVNSKTGAVTLTKSDVGLTRVDDTSDAEKPVSSAQATALFMKENVITPATTAQYYRGDKSWQTLDKGVVGLSNVENTSDASKPISVAQKAVNDKKADLVNGIVPTSQLPSYVDNVQEYATLASFPTTGMSNVVYLSVDTNKPYRWGGSSYVEISSAGIALGETSATAYRGDRGKTAYDHTSLTNNPHAVTKAQVGLSNVDNTADADKPINQAMLNAFGVKADLVNGKVPASQLPDSSNLQLGETATSAYRGDRGKIAFDHTTLVNNPHSVTKSQVGLSNVDNTSDAAKPISTATQTAINAKINIPSVNGAVPVINLSGQITHIPYANGLGSSTIPTRGPGSNFDVGTPLTNAQVANKAYVDAAAGLTPISTTTANSVTTKEFTNRYEYTTKVPFNRSVGTGASAYVTITTTNILPAGVTIDGADEHYISIKNSERDIFVNVWDNASRAIMIGLANTWTSSATALGTVFIKLVRYK